jgi:hypothetical protein
MIKYLAKRGGSIYVVNVDYAGAIIYQNTVKPISCTINPRSTDFSRVKGRKQDFSAIKKPLLVFFKLLVLCGF